MVDFGGDLEIGGVARGGTIFMHPGVVSGRVPSAGYENEGRLGTSGRHWGVEVDLWNLNRPTWKGSVGFYNLGRDAEERRQH